MEEISINSHKRQEFTAEYLFAEEIVKTAVAIRTIQKSFAVKIELGYNFITKTWRKKIKDFFLKEGLRLDEHVRRHTCTHGQPDYSNQAFLSCVLPFIEEYKPECESEEEFLIICSKISYVAAYFLKENIHADVIDVAVDQVYKILVDTIYPSVLIKGQRLEEYIFDRKYRFAYNLTKNLVELKGIPVPELELPNSDNFMFTSKHKEKIKDLFTYEWAVLDKTVKCFAIGTNDFGDDSLEQCMDNIVKEYGWVQNTEEKLLQVSARVAYVAAAFPSENRTNAMQLAVDRIHQMIKVTSQYKKYKNDKDYRFACDLIDEVSKMRSNPLSFDGSSFSMVVHWNKIEHLLNGEKPELDKTMRMVINDSESSENGVSRFFNLWKQVKIDNKPGYRSTEQIVFFCTRIAYLAACFSRNSNGSNAPGLALEYVLEIIKDMRFFTNSKEAMNMHMSDKHYRFAFGVVKAILEIMSVPVSDKNWTDSCNITIAQMKKMRKVILKERSQLEKSVEKLTDKFGVLDYSDGKFIQLMFHFLNDNRWHRTTEKEFIYVCLKIAYMSAFFSERNINSNAPFLAANRIYEMTKEKSYFKNLNGHQVLIAKTRDKHYRFTYDVVRTVLEIKEIPLSTLYLPDPGDIPSTDKYKNKIKMLLLKERFLLDEMLGKLDNSLGHLDYSDDKFLRCMDEFVDYDYDKITEEELLKDCSRIAYMSAGFLEKNCNSNATLLAVNHIYEMRKQTYFCQRMENDTVEEEDLQFAFDLVKAAFEIRTNPFFKMETIHSAESFFTISQINEIQTFLSKEWSRLHELVKKITEINDSSDFRDEQFLECMRQIISNYAFEQKSERELTFVCSRIAYVAIYFRRENNSSNALELAIEQIYQMRREFCQFSNTTNLRETDSGDIMKEKLFFRDVQDKKYRFAHDLVGAVMELQNTPVAEEELPDPEKLIFTHQHRTKIKKLFRKQSTKIEQVIENVTNTEGGFDYSDNNFLHCMDIIFKSHEDELATKNRFVRLCARMAYPVSFFIRKNINSNARILAIERIHDMVKKSSHFNKDMEEKEKFNV